MNTAEALKSLETCVTIDESNLTQVKAILQEVYLQGFEDGEEDAKYTVNEWNKPN